MTKQATANVLTLYGREDLAEIGVGYVSFVAFVSYGAAIAVGRSSAVWVGVAAAGEFGSSILCHREQAQPGSV